MRIDSIRGRRRGGSALILALWTLFFLAILALAVGAHVSANLELARALRDGTLTRMAARVGVETAISLVHADSNEWDAATESWCSDEETFRDVPAGADRFSVVHAFFLSTGAIATNYGVADEERRIHLNLANRSLLKALGEIACELEPEVAEALADAIIDWRDTDDHPLTGGAEKDYYAGLAEPYTCHDGDLQVERELLLVKGMEPELFLKMEPHVTVFGSGKINANTADAVVLECVAHSRGGDEGTRNSLVKKIEAFRSAGNFFDEPGAAIGRKLNDFAGLTGEEASLLNGMSGLLTVGSTCFRGLAVGRVEGVDAAGTRIDFVFDRGTREKLYWYEH
ncbi:MAG: general secretion pathway protein GspK [Lentisphaerae bacterium]|nr:general secretion pathway protein GspK [Lentisphaerota bacterium]